MKPEHSTMRGRAPRPFNDYEEAGIRFWEKKDLTACYEALTLLQPLPRRQRLVQEAIERKRRLG